MRTGGDGVRNELNCEIGGTQSTCSTLNGREGARVFVIVGGVKQPSKMSAVRAKAGARARAGDASSSVVGAK